jgi:hypothetical protein
MALTLTTDECTELERRVRSRKIRAEAARRAQVILMLADGTSFDHGDRGLVIPTMWAAGNSGSKWSGRLACGPKYRGQSARTRTAALEARVIDKTPPAAAGWGSTPWSTRSLGKVLGISHVLLASIWGRAGLQPHCFERYMPSDDLDFEQKGGRCARVVVECAAVCYRFCVAEKTAIQALDPLGRSRPGVRNVTALSTFSTAPRRCMLPWTLGPMIIGQTLPRHTSAAFVDFLGDIVTTETAAARDSRTCRQPLGAQGHARASALDVHPQVHLHFIPTYASLLNHVERRFAKIEHDLLARRTLRSLPDLARKIRPYIIRYHQDPKPIRWTYSNPAHRITTD